MKKNKVLLLAVLPFALAACDSGSSGSVEPMSADSSNSSSSGLEPSDGSSSSIEWNLPVDPSQFWEGAGSEEAPYEIKSEENLMSLINEVNNSALNFKGVAFKLTGDVVLSGKWKPIGYTKGQSNRAFSGTFDGGNFKISGLTVDETTNPAGLFGIIQGATIKNLKLEGTVKGGSYASLLVGKAESSVIQNVEISGTVEGGDFTGGVAGSLSKTTLENVTMTGTVTGKSSVGGIAGTAITSALKNVVNNASVTGSATVGGIVSNLSMDASLEKCINKGAVTGTQDVAGVAAKASQTSIAMSGNEGAVKASDQTASSVGGVVAVASNSALINQVYNIATIEVGEILGVGGIVGKLSTNSMLKNAFNQGNVVGGAGTQVGGVVGTAEECTISGVYTLGTVPKIATSSAVAGQSKSSAELSGVYYNVANQVTASDPGTPMEATAMASADFVTTLNALENVWTRADGVYNGFPFFTWQVQ